MHVPLYYITKPTSFSGGDVDSECSIYNGNQPLLIGCSGNSLRLTDNITDHFIGWDSDKIDSVILALGLDKAGILGQVDTYFYNHPELGFGLPALSMLEVSYTVPTNQNSLGPILFSYANNQHLSQSDNNTAMVSVIITTDWDLENFSLFDFLRMTFDFPSSHHIKHILISKTRLFSEAGMVQSCELEISF